MSGRGVDTLGAMARAGEYSRQGAWPAALTALLLAQAFVIAAYWDTAAAMVGIWARSDTFAHGFVVPLIVIWLVWRRRKELAVESPRPAWGAVPLLAISGLAWLLGELAAANALSQLALVVTLILSVPAVLGTNVARRIAFPLAFLLFAVPIGEFVMPVLMDWTANFAVLGLRLSGVPVYREGLNFVIPSGNWSVVEACSGVRYLIASLCVGTLFGYLTYRSMKRRLLFMLAALVVPVFANWVRAYMIVMLGHLSGNRLAVGVDHLIYGWLFFGFVVVIMFWIGAHWREDGDVEVLTVLVEPAAAAGPRHRVWLGALAAVTAACVGVSAHAFIGRPRALPTPAISLPPTLGDWTVAEDGLVDWQPHFVSPSAELRRVYRRGGEAVAVYVGFYRNQNHERKLITSSNVLVTSTDPVWRRLADGRRELVFDSQTITARTALLRGPPGPTWVVWQWYWVNGALTGSDLVAKLLTVKSQLGGKGDDGAVVAIYAPQDEGSDPAAVLASFAKALAPQLDAMLRHAGDQR